MRILIPLAPPNEHACIALYHPQRNAWWLVMSTHRSDDRLPWEDAIQDTGGTLCNPYVAASFVKSSYGWKNLQNEFRTQMSNGFTIADGGFEHISPIGTRWLASDRSLNRDQT